MEARFVPVSVVDVIDMIISGREKLAKELVTELQLYKKNTNGRKYQ